MRAHIYTALLMGFRSHSFHILLVLTILVLGVAILAADFSGRGPATIIADIGFSGLRMTLTLMALFWVQELLAKDIEGRALVHTLSFPQTRASYLLGRYLGITVLIGIATLAAGGLLLLAVSLNPVTYSQATPLHLGWPVVWAMLYLLVDVLTVTAFAVLIATLSTTAFLTLLVGLGFAIITHALGPLADFMRFSPQADEIQQASLGPIIETALLLLPDLDQLDLRDGFLYGAQIDWREVHMALFRSLIYAALCFFGAVHLFNRREFS